MIPLNNQLGELVLQSFSQLLQQFVSNNTVTQYEGVQLNNSAQQNAAGFFEPVMSSLWPVYFVTDPYGVTHVKGPIDINQVRGAVAQYLINMVNRMRQYQQPQQQNTFGGFGCFQQAPAYMPGAMSSTGGFNNFAAANQQFAQGGHFLPTSGGFLTQPETKTASSATTELFGNAPIRPTDVRDTYQIQQPVQKYEVSTPAASTVEYQTRQGRVAEEHKNAERLKAMVGVAPAMTNIFSNDVEEDITESKAYQDGLALMEQDPSEPLYCTVDETVTRLESDEDTEQLIQTLSSAITYTDIARYKSTDTGIVTLYADLVLPGYFSSEEKAIKYIENKSVSHMRTTGYTQYAASIHWNKIVQLPVPVESVYTVLKSWEKRLGGKPCNSSIFLKEFLSDKRNTVLFDYFSTGACDLFNSASRMNLTYPDNKYINSLCPVIEDIWAVPLLFMKDSSVISDNLREALEDQPNFVPKLKTTIDAVTEQFYPKRERVFLDPYIEEDRKLLLAQESCGVTVNGKSGIDLLQETDEDIVDTIIHQLLREGVYMVQQHHTYDTNNPLPTKMFDMRKGQSQRIKNPRNTYEVILKDVLKKYPIITTTNQVYSDGLLFHGTALNDDLLNVCSAHLSYDA